MVRVKWGGTKEDENLERTNDFEFIDTVSFTVKPNGRLDGFGHIKGGSLGTFCVGSADPVNKQTRVSTRHGGGYYALLAIRVVGSVRLTGVLSIQEP